MGEKRGNIVLDLDQTIIAAIATEDYDFHKNKRKAKGFKYHDMDGYYIVFERPGLQKFLDYLFRHYDVTVWTAASKDYALFIIDKIILSKPGRRLKNVFFSYHCDVSSDLAKGTKDLTCLPDIFKVPGYSAKNTVILDDYDEVHKTQPGGCIVVEPFEFEASGSEKDGFLVELETQLHPLREAFAKGRPITGIVKGINRRMAEWVRGGADSQNE